MRHVIGSLFNSLLLSLAICLFNSSVLANNSSNVPILTYHNFDPLVPGSITVSTERFEEQLKWLKANEYTVIPLQELVSYLRGEKSSPIPEKAVVLTVDDGKESVYKYMLPLVLKYKVPVTLFIYPSAISNAAYALTWDQLRELQKTELFDIQSHTYWHPNFPQEKKRLSADEYKKFVTVQLLKSKEILDKKLNINVNLLAWPYGIYDDYLVQEANKAGYIMTFSIDDRPANKSENMLNQPRYIIVEVQSMKTFAAIVSGKDHNLKHQKQ